MILAQLTHVVLSRLSATHSDRQYSLPRSYDRQQIRDYWIGRPLSVMKRLGKISYELSPCLASYLHYTFYLSKRNDPLEQQHQNQEILDASKTHQAVQLREALTNLGPAFVKAGQQLAIRPDLVPPVVLKELQKLCDSVRPIPDAIALELLQNELGLAGSMSPDPNAAPTRKLEDIFENLHLVAAASLGQVYKAKLKESGQDVAIKVRTVL